MPATTETQSNHVIEIDIEPRPVAEATPAWLEDRRKAGRSAWDRLGLPTTSQEEWRFTSLRAIERSPFARTPDVAPDVDLSSLRLPAIDGPVLVFVDGRLSTPLSSTDGLPAGVWFGTLAEALRDDAARLESHLGGLADVEDDAFGALNTAMLDDASVFIVPKNVACPDPVRVIHVTTSNVAVHPRTLFIVEEGAEATIVEDFVQSTPSASLTNGVTEVYVAANARAFHYALMRESDEAFNVSSLHVRQDRDSHFESHTALLGGAILRNDVRPVLVGDNCESVLNGLYIGQDARHMDNHMRVRHSAEHCRSRQYYRGVLAGESHGVFTGRIVVDRGAQKTDAIQSNQNLLLSNTARANTKPQLEIYADDVRCTHGATIGELDHDAVMYLRCRGLDPVAARGLLVYAFAHETLDRMGLDPVRSLCTELMLEMLPETRAVAGVL